MIAIIVIFIVFVVVFVDAAAAAAAVGHLLTPYFSHAQQKMFESHLICNALFEFYTLIMLVVFLFIPS